MSAGPVEVDIRALAAGGAGVGDLPDGRVVFVPRTAPGDRARIHVVKSKKRWAQGELEEILDASPDRTDAPCALYRSCGGCQLQHLPYEEQLRWKGRFVADALTRIGGLDDVAVPSVVASPERLRYRDRMSFTLRRLRGGRTVAGLHELARPSRVLDVRGECLLPRAALGGAWLRLRGAWGEGASLLPDGGSLRLTLRVAERAPVASGAETTVGAPTGAESTQPAGSAASARDGFTDVELVVDGGAPDWKGGPLLAAVDGLVAIWHRPSGGSGAPALVAGDAEGARGSTFEQANEPCARLLRAHVVSVAMRSSGAGEGQTPPSAIDAYCGSGPYGRALAEAGWRVTGVESDGESVARAAAAAPGGFDVVEGRVEERLGGLLPTDLLIVNPPRTGLHADVPGLVLARPPGAIVYVSCDPATLARDVASLSPRYRVAEVACFDLFPQTAEVETVAVLT